MIEQLKAQKLTLIDYLKSKILANDWHAVQDATSDIREIDAEIKILVSIQNQGTNLSNLKLE